MIIVLKPETGNTNKFIEWLKDRFNVEPHLSCGEHANILVLIGDTSNVDTDIISSLDMVEKVIRVQEPYKLTNRKFHPLDTVIDINGAKVGGGNFIKIAGPCAVESQEQIIKIAKEVKMAGANMLRGGAFKPRTSPYSFQGLGKKGIDYLLEAKKETGLPIVTEIMDLSDIDLFKDVDVLQVGSRNMQNFRLLKELGKLDKPILLKRGLANTIEELLMSAEYIVSGGNEKVILCERGIRTFETSTRNTLDISAVPVLKEKTHLPVIVDPSHATGVSRYVRPVSLAATAAGVDGLIIEVHDDPEHAWSDGKQSITPGEFSYISSHIDKIRADIVCE